MFKYITFQANYKQEVLQLNAAVGGTRSTGAKDARKQGKARLAADIRAMGLFLKTLHPLAVSKDGQTLLEPSQTGLNSSLHSLGNARLQES